MKKENKIIISIFISGLFLGMAIVFGITSHPINTIPNRFIVKEIHKDSNHIITADNDNEQLDYYEKVYNAFLDYVIPVNDSDVVTLYFHRGYLYVNHSEIVNRGNMPGYNLYRFGIDGCCSQYFRNVLADEFAWDISNWKIIKNP